MVFPLILGLGAALAGGAAAVSGFRAAKAARHAQRAQVQQQNLRAARQAREDRRNTIISYAHMQQAQENAGVSNGSAVGGLYSIASQGGSTAAFNAQSLALANQAGWLMDKAAGLESQQQLFSAASKLMFQGSNTDFSSLFGSNGAQDAQIPGPTTQINYGFNSTLGKPAFSNPSLGQIVYTYGKPY